MLENDEASSLTRRRFVRLSGVVGAGAVLAGAGPVTGQGPHAAAQPLGGLCGDVNDSGPEDFLWWARAQPCGQAHQMGMPEPSFCLVTTDSYTVLHGDPVNSHNFLLVPTTRIKGIECPTIWINREPNYWQGAWDNATSGPAQVMYPAIGLGVNSADISTSTGFPYRGQDQLHIHMAGILPNVQTVLNSNDGNITTSPANWVNSIVQIPGSNQIPHSYRALRVPNLADNVFWLLENYVARGSTNMAHQTLIVTPRNVGNGGFYILNSQQQISGGTGTCDLLLVYI